MTDFAVVSGRLHCVGFGPGPQARVLASNPLLTLLFRMCYAIVRTEANAVQLLAQGFAHLQSLSDLPTQEPHDADPSHPTMPQGLQRGMSYMHLTTTTTSGPSAPRSRLPDAHTPTSSTAGRDRPFTGLTPPSRSRTFRGSITGTSVHPVMALGWQPRCQVVCNGLRGEFLGGHDRDMFIRCTSPEYAALLPVDAALGGSIMSCSQFERAAGRELSKKWKESIHVVGEGEGSRATLISWIKRTAEREFGTAVVGKQVWVCWCADAEYYQGTIQAYNPDSGKHTVRVMLFFFTPGGQTLGAHYHMLKISPRNRCLTCVVPFTFPKSFRFSTVPGWRRTCTSQWNSSPLIP
jgi:hypothetical protein